MSISILKRALLVGAYLKSEAKKETEENLEELERLCDTYGLETIQKMAIPLKKMESATFFGSGKIDELIALCHEEKIDLLVCDDELSPHQQRNLEELFKRPIIDRAELIIEIFAQSAKTREARLQIELATIRYQFPRLKRLWTHLGRQTAGGAGFTKGAGEKQIELDRRTLRRRLSQLEKELEAVASVREVQRKARRRSRIPTFAIVGYTNAGKSTLLNALTQAGVVAEDKLFATLDTTVRKYFLPNRQEILLVDTVGFIRKIPHLLVAAFKSTLEEALYTDILLHLIDVSVPTCERQAQDAMKVLEELGATGRPIITVLNKIDRAPSPLLLHKLRLKYPKTVQVSALHGTGLDQLLEMMSVEISKLRTLFHLKIPQSQYALISELMREGRVIASSYEENDVILEVEVPSSFEARIAPYQISS